MGCEESFICPRCGNQDPKYIGMRNGRPYCRKCISFVGTKAASLPSGPKTVELKLHYDLSGEQKQLSQKIVSNYLRGVDTLVYAVCGAGKTELSYGVIEQALRQGHQVGFALPRRDVVIELFWRLKGSFSSSIKSLPSMANTHSLWKATSSFSPPISSTATLIISILLVMDEIDAFPFKGNDVLIAMYHASLRGHCVMMSATPSKEILAEFHQAKHEVLELRTRFHKHPIPVPKIWVIPHLLQPLFVTHLLKQYRQQNRPCFVFSPTIAAAEELYSFVSVFAGGGNVVHSKRPGREEIISDFKKGQYRYLVTTSVLERGVTISDLQVIVVGADDKRIYTSSTLIQIAGRVGRKSDAPSGMVSFIAEKPSEEMHNAIKEINFCNTFL
jgi:competence protein ComFA